MIGKSTGIALLMAAALLAALFAMGVFSASGVGANVKSNPAPKATLDDIVPGEDGVTLTVTFEINDDIDGAPTGTQADDNVTITVPDQIAVIAAGAAGFDTDNISVTQGGNPVGKVVDPIAVAQSIVITVADAGNNNVVRDETITVAISDLTLADDAFSGDVSILQTGQAAAQIASLAIYDAANALSGLSATLSNSVSGAEDVTLTLKFSTAEGEGDGVTITLPPEYNIEGEDGPVAAITITSAAGNADAAVVTPTRDDVDTGDTIAFADGDINPETDYTVTVGADMVTAPDAPTGGFTNPDSADSFEVKFAQGDIIPAGTASFSVNDPVVDYEPTGSTEPRSDQSLTVRGFVDYSDADNITVNLNKFGVPSSIADNQVVVSVGDNSANPSDIEIDGTKVTLVAPFEYTSGTSTAKLSATVNDLTTITFRRAAGITLPTLHGDYDIKVSTSETPEGTAEEEKEAGGDGVTNTVAVKRQVKVSPASGKRGTEITITAKGYTDNTHDVVMGSGSNSLTKTADATDGELTLKIDTSVKNNDDNSVFQGPHDTATTITVGDAEAKFTIKASFSWKPESPTPGQDITITLADIDPVNPNEAGSTNFDADDDEAPTITIGGEEVQGAGNAGDDKRSTWKGQVHGDTPLGNRRIAVSVGEDDLTAQNITVGTNELTVTPTTVVPRQTISIDGDGFTKRGTVDLSEVSVDGVPVRSEEGETQAINNNGNISFDIAVPDTVSSGPATVKVVGSGDRIGTASITIAKAEITVSPTESLRGEDITVSGTGFPAGDLVLIKYNDGTVSTASTSPTGTFERDITVPARATINPGGTYEVEAVSQVNAVDVSATVDHDIKDPEISMSPTSAAAGSSITITGSNFKGFLQVHSIVIGGQDVTPVPAPSTDQWGSFTASNIQVPQLDATRHAVKVTVGASDGSDGDATEFLTVVVAVAAPAPTDPADVFADLVEAGSLSRVWYLDPESQTWSFYDPDPDFAAFNELTEVKSGETYILIITAEDTFGTKTLYPGTQFVTIP